MNKFTDAIPELKKVNMIKGLLVKEILQLEQFAKNLEGDMFSYHIENRSILDR